MPAAGHVGNSTFHLDLKTFIIQSIFHQIRYIFINHHQLITPNIT